jgi:ribosomal protein S18 acetylase RimI-like enzyme
MIEIVDAQPGDAEAIAFVHAMSWKATYRGILSDDYLDGEADRERVEYWYRAMATQCYPTMKLARDGDQVAGFVALHDDPDDEGYAMTIEHLHLLPDAKGQGLGKVLMLAAAKAVKRSGGSNVCLWVFEDNRAAIGFYERLGGVTDAHGTDVMADKPDRRIVWHDLDALIEVCEASS